MPQGLVSGRPSSLPARDFINGGLLLLNLAAAGALVSNPLTSRGLKLLYFCAASSGFLGLHLTGSIGGADMPVVITCLNSASGWALCAEGFMLTNPLLITVGALIGSSGAVLTGDMCSAMNRQTWLSSHRTHPPATTPAAPPARTLTTRTVTSALVSTTHPNALKPARTSLSTTTPHHTITPPHISTSHHHTTPHLHSTTPHDKRHYAEPHTRPQAQHTTPHSTPHSMTHASLPHNTTRVRCSAQSHTLDEQGNS